MDLETSQSDYNPMSPDQLEAAISGREINESPVTQAAPVETVNPYDKYKFTANGKEIVPKDDDYMKSLMSKGYDYAQKQNEMNQRGQQLAHYEQVDKWAKSNPDKWNHLYGSIFNSQTPDPQTQQQQQAQSADPNLAPVFEKLNKVEEKLKYLDELKEEKDFTRRENEDKTLREEVKSIKETYKDVDFTSLDADGKSLEYRIMEHGVQNGINSFKTAFKDLYHDNLMKMAETKGMEKGAKEIQKHKKLGLLGETPAPLQQMNQPTIKSMSYDDLAQLALKDLGHT